MGDFATDYLDGSLQDYWPNDNDRISSNDSLPEKDRPLMPSVTKTKVGTKFIRPLRKAKASVSLPTELNVPPTDLSDFVTLLFGEKGIGKTSLASQFKRPITAQWEPGRRHLPILMVPKRGEPPLNWLRYKEYQRLALESRNIDTIVNDTIDRAYRACLQQVCKERGYTHPNDAKDYGQTWSAVNNEFEDTLNEIHASGKTPVFISHAKYKDVEDALTRTSTEMFVPTASDKCLEYMRAVCDFVFCLTKRETERVIVVRGTSTVFASCGVPDTFLCPDTGKPLAEIPMGSSPKEAYRNLCLGFQNKIRGRILEAPPETEPEEEEEEEKPRKKKFVFKKK